MINNSIIEAGKSTHDVFGAAYKKKKKLKYKLAPRWDCEQLRALLLR